MRNKRQKGFEGTQSTTGHSQWAPTNKDSGSVLVHRLLLWTQKRPLGPFHVLTSISPLRFCPRKPVQGPQKEAWRKRATCLNMFKYGTSGTRAVHLAGMEKSAQTSCKPCSPWLNTGLSPKVRGSFWGQPTLVVQFSQQCVDAIPRTS